MKTILSSETMDIPEGVKVKVKAKIIEVEGPRGKLTRDFKHLNLDFQLITDAETGQRKLKVDAWFGSRKTTAAIRTALSHVGNLITGVTKGYRYKMRFVYAHFPINANISSAANSIEIRNFLGEKKCAGVKNGIQYLVPLQLWFDLVIGHTIKMAKCMLRSALELIFLVRKVQMLDGVSIVRSEKVKDELVLDGNDIELVSRSAALINQVASLFSLSVIHGVITSRRSSSLHLLRLLSSFVQKCHVKNKDIRKFLDGIYVSEKGTIREEE
ncbi:hypothetical protein RJ639_016166 [Escallonia herrerae]|uniref:Large ribosomal subunit protein uL6 alpha-beta domain-containing protein n=1 Tax=Escallonia herrerae TaxID=1293975 RepID=A0AA88VH52_9ASTE|nr:hypothetical protein RJ639_016166 [Escallonia herrerae]